MTPERAARLFGPRGGVTFLRMSSAVSLCPLCDARQIRPSWLGSTSFNQRIFSYLECEACGSLFCDPMPDAEVLQQMYGQDYSNAADAAPEHHLTAESSRVVAWLERRQPPGTFIDYGCRKGTLLTAALERNWRAIGVELDPAVAADTERHTGARVVVPDDPLLSSPLADVLHLGDVIEHLTDLNNQMPAMLRLLKPGGLLIAQGPLEANRNFFTLMIRASRRLKRSRVIEMAPMHVVLATNIGQRTFFLRFGLRELEYSLSEVDWPAPSELNLRSPRDASLFLIRRVSRVCSSLKPQVWGNRYFYVGEYQARDAAPDR